MRIDFNQLRTILRASNAKLNDAANSSICLKEFLSLINNLIDHNSSLKQDEAANIIMSLQNWMTRREIGTSRDVVNIGDIFYTDLGLNYKPEFSYHHPVIILEDIGNMVMVVPVSTSPHNISQAYHPIDNPKGSKYLRKVYGNDNGSQSDGFEKTGAILLTDLKTVSKGKLISKKGSLKDINNKESLFREVKRKVFQLAFPKEHIVMLKMQQEIEKINNEHNKLKQEYNELEEKYKQILG